MPYSDYGDDRDARQGSSGCNRGGTKRHRYDQDNREQHLTLDGCDGGRRQRCHYDQHDYDYQGNHRDDSFQLSRSDNYGGGRKERHLHVQCDYGHQSDARGGRFQQSRPGSYSGGNKKVSLNCAVVGVDRCFLVEINESQLVRDLELEISQLCATHVGSSTISGGLNLFVAKTSSGSWMDDGNVPSFFFRGDKSGKPQGVRPMAPTSQIKNALDLAESSALSETAQIHVLVGLATEDLIQLMQHELQLRKEESLRCVLRGCTKYGDLPKQGDFLKLFEWTDDDCGNVKDIAALKDITGFMGSQLYVRKEVLCVLELLREFLRQKFDTGTRTPKQFIMIGSSGTGKSCILALICFYHAVVKKRSVVWYRYGDGANEVPITRLFRDGKYFEWPNTEGNVYKSLNTSLRGNVGSDTCLFCLDGLTQEVMESKSLVPYWKLGDLEDLAKKLGDPNACDVASRYYVSGGNLREFLCVDTAVEFYRSLTLNTADSEMLLTLFGRGSSEEVDRIRMLGVNNTAITKQYVDAFFWHPCVFSMMALQHLADLMTPKFFEKLICLMRELNDPRLEELAVEGHLHALARQRSSQFNDNVDRSTFRHNYKDLMKRDRQDDLRSREETWPPVTKSTKHKCNEEVLRKLAQPFLDDPQTVPVCYVVLLADGNNEDMVSEIENFRLKPVQIATDGKKSLYVAKYELIDELH